MAKSDARPDACYQPDAGPAGIAELDEVLLKAFISILLDCSLNTWKASLWHYKKECITARSTEIFVNARSAPRQHFLERSESPKRFLDARI